MIITHDSSTDISIYTKEYNRKTESGYFPLLKFRENLYNSCQNKFSQFINKTSDIKLLINNRINQKIPLNDYIINSYKNKYENKLTPIPYINKRKLKNNLEKKELKNFQRNVVLMRRLEYTNKMKENKMIKKYKNQIPKILILQKIIRGYLVRKVIYQINIIKETLANFFYSIHFCIMKKYFYLFKKNIYEKNKEEIFVNENDEYINICNNNSNTNINIYNENTSKNSLREDFENQEEKIKKENKEDKNIKKQNDICNVEYGLRNKDSKIHEKFNNSNKESHDMINKWNNSQCKQKEKIESLIENDDYIEFSNKISNKNINIINPNRGNRNPKNDILNYQLSSLSSIQELKRTKTQTIQRQFRKYLYKKGYYGHFDKRKIAIIYLLKNMIIYNIRPYILNILRELYREKTGMKITQEENYFNIKSERIDILNKNYLAATREIN